MFGLYGFGWRSQLSAHGDTIFSLMIAYAHGGTVFAWLHVSLHCLSLMELDNRLVSLRHVEGGNTVCVACG